MNWGIFRKKKPEPGVLDLVAERLSAFGPPWTVDGPVARGPYGATVVLRDNHTDEPRHLDLDYVLGPAHGHAVLSDCVTGIGETVLDGQRRAVDVWATITAATALELGSPRGEHANHYRGDHPLGFPGWHTLHAGIIGFGIGTAPDVLQDWAVNNPLLPLLADALRPGLDRPELNGVKLFFGGRPGNDIAEVRVNGQEYPPASAALAALDWPRLPETAFVRTFVLLVHPDEGAAADTRDGDAGGRAAPGSARAT